MNASLRSQLLRELVAAEPTPAPQAATLTVGHAMQTDNHVYLYSGITSESCLTMLREVRYADAMLRAERASRDVPAHIPATPIWLHIQSYGGDLFAGLSACDQLARFQTPVYSIIEGVCASAGTLLSMACARRYILPNSFMLVHQLSTLVMGTHEQFKDEMKLQETAMNRMVQFYTTHSAMGEVELRETLKRDFWMSASEALEKGFVDEIMSVPGMAR